MVRRVILAAGHGGGDPGATGQGTHEAAECIQIVNRLADKLRADGQVEVHVVPHELNLIPTIDWINARWKNLEDGLCIEVHKNATVNAHGIEAWHFGGDARSAGYGANLLDGCAQVPGMPRVRGNFPDTQNRHGSLGFVRETNPYAILMEMGFVSDGGDGVDDYADNIYAEGLFRGVLKVFGLSPKPTPIVTPAPVPQPTTSVKYKVYDSANKQLGAYNTEAGAWNKYQTGGAKIIETATGRDVTSEFVAKFRVIAPTPPVGNEPHPEANLKLDQIISELGVIRGLIQWVVDKLKGVFK
jgi:hypothetical protein